MKKFMQRLTCKVYGHDWREIWNGGPHAKAKPMLRCARCNEVRWRF